MVKPKVRKTSLQPSQQGGWVGEGGEDYPQTCGNDPLSPASENYKTLGGGVGETREL